MLPRSYARCAREQSARPEQQRPQAGVDFGDGDGAFAVWRMDLHQMLLRTTLCVK
jgi:hypothetical protein